MNVSTDEFFKEVTLRICSSLDIQTALNKCFEYMKEIIPLDTLQLGAFDNSLGAVRYIACAPESAWGKINEILPLPKDIWEWEQTLLTPPLSDSRNMDPMVKRMSVLTNNYWHSTIPLPLHIDGKKIGALAIRAHKDMAFDEEHLKLASVIMEPFTIALSNTLAHQELLSYKDRLVDDNRFLLKELSSQIPDEIIGGSHGILNVIEQVRMVAPLNNTVLLLGETGVGKEIIANSIHYSSPRSGGPFIKINCGAIPETLIDSELFGHEKGAFTGAGSIKRGRFERANGGTIFLDEIGELPPQAQVRLLRILQNKEFERVGGTRAIPSDVRVIAATHRNLQQMVADKTFREDLWFRLNVFPITIPPLRKRRDDIPALTRYLLNKKSREIGLQTVPPIAIGALEKLVNYSWPGNVRELSNIIEREVIRFNGKPLTFDSVYSGYGDKAEQQEAGAAFIHESLDKHTANHITRVLKYTKGRINGSGGAAEILDLKPSTLRSKMEKLGIGRADFNRQKN